MNILGASSLDYGNPIPCVPFPSVRGRGDIRKRDFVPLRRPIITREIVKTGELERGETPLHPEHPLSFEGLPPRAQARRKRGIKGVR